MLSERQLEALLDVFRKRMQGVTEEYLIRMGEHLRDIGQLTASDVNRIVEMKRLNANLEQMKREIAKAARMSIEDVEKIFKAVAESDLRFANKVFASDHEPSIKANPALERILKAQAKITNQALSNLSQTTLISDGYRNAVDVAVQTVQGGIVDYNSAIRRAMKEAAKEGLRIGYPEQAAKDEKRKGARVYYPNHPGKIITRRLDSAVRMNVLDGIRAVNQDIMRQVGKEFNADGIELSAHALCAEDHLPYQGHQMSNEVFERLQNRLDRPFGKWNCRHNWWPIILGVSRPAHTPEELRAYAENSNELIEIDGITKTRYQWTQEQRRIETAIRYQKDIAVAAKASGDMMTRRECQHVIRGLNKKYENISEIAGLRKQHERMKVAGFSAVKTVDQLKKPEKSGIIKMDDGKTYMRIYNADGKEKYRYLQTDAIQKLNSTEEIARYFIYTDKYGDKRSPCSDEFTRVRNDDQELPPITYHLAGFKLNVQKEIAEGIQWARKTFKLDVLPNKITKGSVSPKADGEYEETARRVTLKNSTEEEQGFATAVHEMTHFADHMNGHVSASVCEEARKNLKLRIQSNKYFNYAYSIAGKRYKDSAELLAHAMENYATNTANPLAEEIARLFIERMSKS